MLARTNLQIARKYQSWIFGFIKIDYVISLALITILIGYTYVESFVSLIVWLILFFSGYLMFSKDGSAKNANFYIFSRSFIVITCIGILNVVDVYNHTGGFYGFGGDDRFFFNNIVHLLKYAEIPKNNIGLYEYILAFPARIISFALSRDLNILDLLPFNWFLGAIIPVLINSVSKLLFNAEIKFEIILLSLLLNAKYYDAMIHLYRDVLLYSFLLLGIISHIKRKYIKFSIYTLLTGVLRGAHSLFLVLFLSLIRVYKSAKSVGKATIMTVLFASSMMFFVQFTLITLPYIGQYYESTIYKSSSLSNYSLPQLVEFRRTIFSKREGHQGYLRKLSYKSGPVSSFVGAALMAFYPITFHFYYFEMGSSNYFPDFHGFSFIEIMKWLSIIAWIWVIPLLFLGFFYCYKRKGNGLALIVFYIISLFSITMISMQSRHGLVFVIFHPILCQLGYELFFEKRDYVFRFKQFQKYVVMFLVMWNIARHLVI